MMTCIGTEDIVQIQTKILSSGLIFHCDEGIPSEPGNDRDQWLFIL